MGAKNADLPIQNCQLKCAVHANPELMLLLRNATFERLYGVRHSSLELMRG